MTQTSTQSSDRTARQALPLGVRAVADARAFALRTLLDWQTGAEVSGSVVLIVSELVTNAVLYGYGSATVVLRREGRALVVEVADRSSVLPVRRPVTDDSEIGRGLHIIETCSRAWGARPDPATGGKIVWARVGLDPHDV